MVYDEERDVLQTLPGAFGVSDDDAVSYRIKTDHPRSNSARVFNLGKPNVSNEAAGDPAIVQDYVDLFHVERLLSLPLWLGGRKVGVLHLANKPSPFTAYDVYRAQMLAPPRIRDGGRAGHGDAAACGAISWRPRSSSTRRSGSPAAAT